MSKSQDYIARIRYQNDLPPPLLPPKLLKYQIHEQEQIDSPDLLSNLYRKQNIKNLIQIDNDLGLKIDLTQQPLLFDPEVDDPTGSAPLDSHVKLHPHDQVLLRDPGIDRAVKNEPNVLFLRRTEYIGSQKSASMNNSRADTPNEEKPRSNGKKNGYGDDIKDIDTPISQLRSIEQTFENATKTLNDFSKLRHPLKKSLKARKVWPLLPDVSGIDQVYSTIRASNLLDSKQSDASLLLNELFREVKLEGNNLSQVSIYRLAEDDHLEKLQEKLNKLDENDEVNEEDERFRFVKQGDYELKPVRMDNTPVSNAVNDNNAKDSLNLSHQSNIKEIALKFDKESGIVYYNVIQAKSEIKKRKLNDSDRQAFDQIDLDELNLRIREPTVQELNIRNNKRHKFDDINYDSIEIEAKEQVVEQQGDEEEDDLDELTRRS